MTARVKDIVRPNKVVWKIGAPRRLATAERSTVPAQTPITAHPTGKVDLYMDLLDDNKVTLSIGWTDEVGNPADAPDAFSATYSVDNSSVIALTDNGDGTAEAAATGTLGAATAHVDVTWSDSSGDHTASGDLLFTVVADMATRVNVTAGTPEHV